MMRSYDITSPDSIKQYADNLTGHTLAQVVNELPLDAYSTTNKGRLGSMVEKFFFRYVPGADTNHNPDFKEAGMELKVTGVVSRKPTADAKVPYKAKERLVLTMIDYLTLPDETWDESTFLKKCRLMLILFYLYEKEVAASDLRFVLPPLKWEFPEEDLQIIRNDWQIIHRKVTDKKAHELSEGDTFYLAACRKGSGGTKERLRKQLHSDIPAKSRAFSLKPSYVNLMIEAAYKDGRNSELITSADEAKKGIEEVVYEKLRPFEGEPVDELIRQFGLAEYNPKSKNLFRTLTMRMLGTKKKHLPEFCKANIVLKTIRLKANGMPSESMSFPTFDFIELSKQDWEQSVLCATLEQKFFFVVFQYDDKGILRFRKAMFWNMPYDDRMLAKKAWLKTREATRASKPGSFPKTADNPVVHVRPHGRNAKDTLELPDGSHFTKQCFWLNARYIASQVK